MTKNRKPTPCSRKISVEELLRFKRQEKPSAEFWQEFDKGLQRKKLQALVQKKTVWTHVFDVFEHCIQSTIPLTAVVVLVFTLFSSRDSLRSSNLVTLSQEATGESSNVFSVVPSDYEQTFYAVDTLSFQKGENSCELPHHCVLQKTSPGVHYVASSVSTNASIGLGNSNGFY